MMDWLDEMTAALDAVGGAGVPPKLPKLEEDERALILELARVASHSSGERTNAPLLCFLLGVAVAHGADLEELADAVRGRV